MINEFDKTYLDLANDVLKNGSVKPSRGILLSTGNPVKTYSVFGRQVRYDLSKGFPLLTTKKVFWKAIAVELLWFLRGDTNVKYLQDNGVKIWDEWATKEQCAKFGRLEGDLGPVYGKQWRRWEAPNYVSSNLYKTSNGTVLKCYDPSLKIDQIANVIEQIKTNPDSRRLIVSGWNPAESNLVALPPCHTMFQFYVNDGKLSCQLYQRSGDVFLGVPFNIASYSLLTHMIAHVTGLEVGDFVHTFGDVHLYENAKEAIELQSSREPFAPPTLWLNPNVKNIDDFKLEDIKLQNYQAHPKIEVEVVV